MSFSDMMESGRGPGVIGMILALVVLAIFALLYLFAFDDGMMGKGKTIESVIAQQADQIDNLELEIIRCEDDLQRAAVLKQAAAKVEAAKTQNKSRDGQIAQLRTETEELSDELSAKIGEFEEYVEEYRVHVRNAAKGRALEQLETTEGKVYKDVSVREVTAVGMEIRHEGGLRRIPFEELPEEMQDHFQFDSKQKELALSKELGTRNRHESNVAAAKEEMRRDVVRNAEENKDEIRRDITAKESQISAYTKEIFSLESAIRSEASKSISNAPQMKRKLNTMKKNRADLEAIIARLRAQL